jgi:hypothetical protein
MEGKWPKKWLKKKSLRRNSIYHKYVTWRIILIKTPTEKVFHDVGPMNKNIWNKILIDHQDFEGRRCMTNNFF